MTSLAQVRLLLVRNLREGFRNPVLAYILPVVIPLAVLVMMAETMARVTGLPGFPTRSYAEWMTPAVVMLTAMTGTGYSAASLVIDSQSGFIDRLRLLDARPAALLISRMLFDVARVLPGGAIVLVVWDWHGLTDIHQVGEGPRKDVQNGDCGEEEAPSPPVVHAGVQGRDRAALPGR